MIIKCTCKHEGQDRLHGVGNRVANPVKAKMSGETSRYRCTVCKTEHTKQGK